MGKQKKIGQAQGFSVPMIRMFDGEGKPLRDQLRVRHYSLRRAKEERRRREQSEPSIGVLLQVANESPGFWKKALERLRQSFLLDKSIKEEKRHV